MTYTRNIQVLQTGLKYPYFLSMGHSHDSKGAERSVPQDCSRNKFSGIPPAIFMQSRGRSRKGDVHPTKQTQTHTHIIFTTGNAYSVLTGTTIHHKDGE